MWRYSCDVTASARDVTNTRRAASQLVMYAASIVQASVRPAALVELLLETTNCSVRRPRSRGWHQSPAVVHCIQIDSPRRLLLLLRQRGNNVDDETAYRQTISWNCVMRASSICITSTTASLTSSATATQQRYKLYINKQRHRKTDRERERERERDRQTDRHTETDRQTGRVSNPLLDCSCIFWIQTLKYVFSISLVAFHSAIQSLYCRYIWKTLKNGFRN